MVNSDCYFDCLSDGAGRILEFGEDLGGHSVQYTRGILLVRG